MEISSLVKILEDIAPPDMAEEFDSGRIGLILNFNNDIKTIAVALDNTNKVIERAADVKADILITHHTLIFKAVNIIKENLSEKLKIIFENQISLYSMHTNYDRVSGGINDSLAKRLELKNVEELELGRIGEMDPVSSEEFAKHVSKKLKTHLSYIGEKKDIRRVMVAGGSCFNSEFMEIAKENDVDAFVSSELKHSDAIRERGNITLVDATHYATENPGMEDLAKKLEKTTGLNVVFIHDDPELKVI